MVKQYKASDVRYNHIKFPPFKFQEFPKWVDTPSGKRVMVKNREQELEATETPEQKVQRLEQEQLDAAERMKTLSSQIDASKNLLSQAGKPVETPKT